MYSQCQREVGCVCAHTHTHTHTRLAISLCISSGYKGLKICPHPQFVFQKMDLTSVLVNSLMSSDYLLHISAWDSEQGAERIKEKLEQSWIWLSALVWQCYFFSYRGKAGTSLICKYFDRMRLLSEWNYSNLFKEFSAAGELERELSSVHCEVIIFFLMQAEVTSWSVVVRGGRFLSVRAPPLRGLC